MKDPESEKIMADIKDRNCGNCDFSDRVKKGLVRCRITDSDMNEFSVCIRYRRRNV